MYTCRPAVVHVWDRSHVTWQSIIVLSSPSSDFASFSSYTCTCTFPPLLPPFLPPSFLSYMYMCTSTCTCMYILCSSNSQTTLNLISQSVEISQGLEVPAKNITLKVSTHLYIVHVHTVRTLYTWNVPYCTLILFSLLKCVCTFLLHRVPKVRWQSPLLSLRSWAIAPSLFSWCHTSGDRDR